MHQYELRQPSPRAWLDQVLADFDSFLLDHAAAERKAAAMATSFVVQYPDRYALHIPLIRMAREELLHYQQVMRLVHRRKLVWERDVKDPYVTGLLKHISSGGKQRLLDRLLLGSVVEARGVERFALVAEGLVEPKLKTFYERLSRSEATHASLFTRLAARYFKPGEIEDGLDRWLDLEAEAMAAVPPRAALH